MIQVADRTVQRNPLTSNFEAPTSGAHPFAARPDPAPAIAPTADQEPPKRLTLYQELAAELERAERLKDLDDQLVSQAHALARQRDALAAKKVEFEVQVATDQEKRMAALLAGDKLPPRTDASQNLEAVAAGYQDIEKREAANTEQRRQLSARRVGHEMAVNDVRWRITVARYALAIVQPLDIAQELATLARVHGRSLAWGQGLILNPNGARDIAGIPLQAALELAANLGEPDVQVAKGS